MSASPILSTFPIGLHAETRDPFLFCAHHLDAYPRGNERQGPAASLAGRNIGMDFEVKDGWRMYHGSVVPGFPVHPHRGFETVTVVLRGVVDHSDSQGAYGRYGNGDVQWMTAGSGLQHAEMFPLTDPDADNPTELFQIWLNLPRAKKMAQPHYRMLWAEAIPTVELRDARGLRTGVTLVAGSLGERQAPPPAPDSWAADGRNEVAIWLIRLQAGARWTLPAATPQLTRMLYFYEGDSLRLEGEQLRVAQGLRLRSDAEAALENGDAEARLLILQGRPIGEPVAQYGPFVMNTSEEIQQAFEDYQATRFGGWPWDRDDPVRPREEGRIARYANGSEERPA